MKTCTRCGGVKDLSDFPRDRRSKSGYLSLCKDCVRVKNQASYQRHAEARKAAQRERNKRDREAKSQYNKAYRVEHRDALIEASRAWRAAGGKTVRSVESLDRSNSRRRLRYATDPEYRERAKAHAALFRKKFPEKCQSAAKRWREANLEANRLYQRDYQRAFNQTPEGRARQAAARLRHRAARQAQRAAYYARRYGAAGEVTNDHLNWVHRWQDHCCVYCNAPLEGGETVEHIVPLARGGENNPHNIALACLSCNTSKNARLLDESEWLPREVRLPAPRIHSLHATALARRLCADAGLLAAEGAPPDDRIPLKGGKSLQVLSTFWMSDRSLPLATVEDLRRRYPDDLLTFDYEWLGRPQALLNIAAAKCGAAESVGARTLDIAAPSLDEARGFMNLWHAQGFAGGSWYLGLRRPSEGDWLAVMSVRRNGGAYELARLAFRQHVPGGLSRLVTAFLRAMPDPGDLLSYADLRFGTGGGYLQAGFEPDGDTVPWYGYVNSIGIHSRQAYRKDLMATELDWFDPAWTEHRLARANGLWRLTGTPQRRFILRAG